MSEDKVSLAYWFPKLQEIGIQTPKTIWWKTDTDFWPLFDGGSKESTNRFLDDLKKRANEWGYPLFLRTGHTSAKHSWKDSCYVTREDDLGKAVFELLEYSGMAMPSLPWDIWVIREFLSLDIHFKAFWGEMPIATERRYFIENGEIICSHPYWPEEAFESIRDRPDDWMDQLAKMNEIKAPSSVIVDSKRVSANFDDAWSLDWAKHQDGSWYAIDMAPMEVSYHWPGCPNG